MSPVNLRERDLGISASRHPVGDLTCFTGWLFVRLAEQEKREKPIYKEV